MLFRSDRKSTRLNSSHTLISYALPIRSEEHTSELQSHSHLVCRLLLEKKKASLRAPVSFTVCFFLASTHDPSPVAASAFYFFFFFNDPAPPEIYTLPLHAALPINDTATTEIYTLSLHDALPISVVAVS